MKPKIRPALGDRVFYIGESYNGKKKVFSSRYYGHIEEKEIFILMDSDWSGGMFSIHWNNVFSSKEEAEESLEAINMNR